MSNIHDFYWRCARIKKVLSPVLTATPKPPIYASNLFCCAIILLCFIGSGSRSIRVDKLRTFSTIAPTVTFTQAG